MYKYIYITVCDLQRREEIFMEKRLGACDDEGCVYYTIRLIYDCLTMTD